MNQSTKTPEQRADEKAASRKAYDKAIAQIDMGRVSFVPMSTKKAVYKDSKIKGGDQQAGYDIDALVQTLMIRIAPTLLRINQIRRPNAQDINISEEDAITACRECGVPVPLDTKGGKGVHPEEEEKKEGEEESKSNEGMDESD